MTKLPTWLLLAAIAAPQLGATECGEIISDPGFDLWCGEQLCSWRVERGEVAQVATWHDGDDGVELVADDTAISQLAPVTFNDGSCIEFELVADVDPGVDVRFKVDVFGDGTVELDEPIPAADWQPLIYRFDIVGLYDGVKFWIAKGSAGHAVVAQLAARICDTGASGSQSVTGLPGPDGARCIFPEDCQSGLCERFETGFPPPATCGSCELGAACPIAGDVCGLAPPLLYTLGASTACVATGSKPLGAQCGVNPECADGLCVFGVCSTCFDTSCGGGEACEPSVLVERPDVVGQYYPAPFVCAPGAGARAAGEPCADPSDCASGTCAGAPRLVCTDGRACAGDADCPAADGLSHGTCATVGVLGGTCQ